MIIRVLGYTLGEMGENMKVNGKMGNSMGTGHTIYKMESANKGYGITGKEFNGRISRSIFHL